MAPVPLENLRFRVQTTPPIPQRLGLHAQHLHYQSPFQRVYVSGITPSTHQRLSDYVSRPLANLGAFLNHHPSIFILILITCFVALLALCVQAPRRQTRGAGHDHADSCKQSQRQKSLRERNYNEVQHYWGLTIKEKDLCVGNLGSHSAVSIPANTFLLVHTDEVTGT